MKLRKKVVKKRKAHLFLLDKGLILALPSVKKKHIAFHTGNITREKVKSQALFLINSKSLCQVAKYTIYIIIFYIFFTFIIKYKKQPGNLA